MLCMIYSEGSHTAFDEISKSCFGFSTRAFQINPKHPDVHRLNPRKQMREVKVRRKDSAQPEMRGRKECGGPASPSINCQPEVMKQNLLIS